MVNPRPQGEAPAMDVEPGGARTPEDELTAIEEKHDGAAQAAGAGDEGGDGKPGDQDSDDASVKKLQEFMVKKGIQDIGKLVDLASELESRNTKLSQDVQRLSAATQYPASPGGFVPPVRPAAAPADDDIDLPENPIELVTDKAKLRQFALNLKQSLRADMERGQLAERFQGLQARVQAKMAQDPEKFQALRPAMYELSFQHPGADIDQLYSMAEQRETAKKKALVDEVKRELGLSGVDAERLKGVISRVRQAPVSGGTGPQVNLQQTDEQKANAELLKAIANADKF